MYKCLCGHIFLVLLSIYLGVELLGHAVILCLTFGGIAKVFSKVTAPFYLATSSMVRVLISPHPVNTYDGLLQYHC